MKESYIHNHVFNHILICIAASNSKNGLKQYWNEVRDMIKKFPKSKIKKLIRIKLELEKNLH